MQRINSHLKTFISQDQNFLQSCTIRSINELDDKIRNISDIYTFQSLIEQLNNNLSRVIYDREKFTQIIKRLLEAVCFAAEKFGYDVIRTTYLIDKISYISRYWKKVLVRQSEILSIVKKQSKFMYILDKNQFLYFLLKASNRLIQKDVVRYLKSKVLNIQSLYYLRQSNIKQYFQRVHVKFIEVVKQTQNQTYLKIQLLTQFIRYTLFQLNFCMKIQDFEHIFQKFFQLTLHTLRLIRKFYSIQIIQMVNIFKNVLIKALQVYRMIYYQNRLKYNRLTIIINIIDKNRFNIIQRKSELMNRIQVKKTQENFFCNNYVNVNFNNSNNNNNNNNNNMKTQQKNSQNFQNPNKYVVKLALRLLKNWKSINQNKKKQTHCKQRSMSDFYQNLQPNFMYKKLSNLQQNQQQHQKGSNFQKQIHHLKNRSKRMHSLQKNQDPNMNNIRIRKQIQQQLYRQFENYQERQVTIEQYREKLMMCRPTVETVNQIKFYKPEKHDQIIKSRMNQDRNNQSKQNFFNNSKYLKLNMIFSQSKKIKVKRNGQIRDRLKL